MIKTPTVFVLGAGASAPFGFPIGQTLSAQVTSSLTKGHDAYRALYDLGFSSDAINEFRDTLYYSGKNSVDAFLEHRREFLRIGKAATAYFLIAHESSERLFDYNENWYRYLYDRMNAPVEKFGENAVSFITFNYDRSLENFLFNCLKHTYGLGDEACAAEIGNIPIIHLHGVLGTLPWQGGNSRPYNVQTNERALRICVESIKVIHEDVTAVADADFSRARQLLQGAERIYLMGFGFNALNIHRLGIDRLPSVEIAGTAYGITNHERAAIDELVMGKVRLDPNPCMSFVRNIVNW